MCRCPGETRATFECCSGPAGAPEPDNHPDAGLMHTLPTEDAEHARDVPDLATRDAPLRCTHLHLQCLRQALQRELACTVGCVAKHPSLACNAGHELHAAPWNRNRDNAQAHLSPSHTEQGQRPTNQQHSYRQSPSCAEDTQQWRCERPGHSPVQSTR